MKTWFAGRFGHAGTRWPNGSRHHCRQGPNATTSSRKTKGQQKAGSTRPRRGPGWLYDDQGEGHNQKPKPSFLSLAQREGVVGHRRGLLRRQTRRRPGRRGSPLTRESRKRAWLFGILRLDRAISLERKNGACIDRHRARGCVHYCSCGSSSLLVQRYSSKCRNHFQNINGVLS